MFFTSRFTIVELLVPAPIAGTNVQVKFTQQPQLQTIGDNYIVQIDAIETYTNDDLDFSPITGALPVATPARLQNAVLTLSIESTNQQEYIPLASLHRISSGAAPAPFVRDLWGMDNIFRVDWTKSFITLVSPDAGANFAYLFGVHYRYINTQQG